MKWQVTAFFDGEEVFDIRFAVEADSQTEAEEKANDQLHQLIHAEVEPLEKEKENAEV